MPIRITGLDLETTGLHQDKGDRIVEIAMITVLYEPGQTMKAIKRFVSRCNPHKPIHPDAMAVHHITDADVAGAPEWESIVPSVVSVLKATDILVAHNMPFDAPFLAGEMLRVSVVPPDCETFCTMENARWATPTGKSPRLQELCFSLDVAYDTEKAHAAEYDILQTLKCLQAGLARGFYTLPTVKEKQTNANTTATEKAVAA